MAANGTVIGKGRRWTCQIDTVVSASRGYRAAIPFPGPEVEPAPGPGRVLKGVRMRSLQGSAGQASPPGLACPGEMRYGLATTGAFTTMEVLVAVSFPFLARSLIMLSLVSSFGETPGFHLTMTVRHSGE